MSVLRRLFLDDDQDRHDEFARLYADDQRTHVYTVDEFEKAIEVGRYDVIHLDHDLGEYITMYGVDMERTGYDAAKILTKAAFTPRTVVCHSWNADGAKRMYRLLRDHGFNVVIRPFGVS